MRTPKNFDGTSSTSKSINGLLKEALSEISERAGRQGDEILQAWSEILGPNFTNLTKATAVRDGVLTVKVKSSTLYSLLSRYEKPRLLERLQELFPEAKLRDIVFRIG